MGLFSFGKKDGERRQHRRHRVFQASYFLLDGRDKDARQCFIHDVSMGGLQLETKEVLEEGTFIVVLVQLGTASLSEKMQVMRRTKFITLRYGCAFIDEETRGAREPVIRNFLETLPNPN